MTSKLDTELLQNIEYVLDKLNVTIEISKADLANYVDAFCRKAIIYKSAMYTMELVIALVALVALLIFEFNKNQRWKVSVKVVKDTVKNNGQLDNKMTLCFINICVAALCALFAVTGVVTSIINLILCFAFPEKVIIEFISSYL